MTLAQIRGFLRAIQRQKSEKQMSYIIATAVATQGDKKGINKAVDDIQKSIAESLKQYKAQERE